MRSLDASLKSDSTSQQTGEILRSLVEKMAVRQHEGLLEVELTGDIADAPLEDIDLHEMCRASRLVKVVSGTWLRVRLQR
jgi:hypothetical protein